MKFIFAILLSGITYTTFSQSHHLFVYYTFTGIEDGYDHQNKIIVYIDGNKVGESESKIESQPNFVRVELPSGNHDIRVENWAYYNNNWELHSTENGYSFDLITTKSIEVTHDFVLRMLYDLDNGVKEDIR